MHSVIHPFLVTTTYSIQEDQNQYLVMKNSEPRTSSLVAVNHVCRVSTLKTMLGTHIYLIHWLYLFLIGTDDRYLMKSADEVHRTFYIFKARTRNQCNLNIKTFLIDDSHKKRNNRKENCYLLHGGGIKYQSSGHIPPSKWINTKKDYYLLEVTSSKFWSTV